jgi:branched-chain amino acid transport system permease protein
MLATLLQALVSGLAVGGAYALVALGFSITFTTTRTLNFGHGEFVSVGAFIGVGALFLFAGKPVTTAAFTGLELSGWEYLLAGLAAVLVMGMLGVLLYVFGVRPFASRPGMAWVMSTLGFGILLQSAAFAVWGPAPVTVPAPFGDDVIRVFGAGVRSQELLLLAVGKAMRAVAANPAVANLMGINVNAVMTGAFFASSALAGLAGFLVAPITSASIFMGLAIGLKGFSGAMIGGLSNPRGCVLGGFVLGLLESYVNLWQSQWREVAIFGLVILVLAIKPTGLFGKRLAEKV